MDIFEIINQNRLKYHFPSKEYKSVMLKTKDDIISKLEINTCKYYLLNSKGYIKKNLKLSSDSLYTEYLNCLLRRDIQNILILRCKLESFDSFVDELDLLLNNLNFDINKAKSKFVWHDIEIVFNTEKKMNEYINKTYKVEDRKFNNLIIINITRLENKIEGCKRLIKKDNTRIKCIKKKLSVIIKVISEFLNFLTDNYVESEYLISLRNETEDILEFYNNLSSNNVQKDISSLSAFSDIKQEICTSRQVRSKSEVREDLINFLKDIFNPVSDQVENIPFLPDFYDIAYDYIKYPSTDKYVSELLAKMDVK